MNIRSIIFKRRRHNSLLNFKGDSLLETIIAFLIVAIVGLVMATGIGAASSVKNNTTWIKEAGLRADQDLQTGKKPENQSIIKSSDYEVYKAKQDSNGNVIYEEKNGHREPVHEKDFSNGGIDLQKITGYGSEKGPGKNDYDSGKQSVSLCKYVPSNNSNTPDPKPPNVKKIGLTGNWYLRFDFPTIDGTHYLNVPNNNIVIEMFGGEPGIAPPIDDNTSLNVTPVLNNVPDKTRGAKYTSEYNSEVLKFDSKGNYYYEVDFDYAISGLSAINIGVNYRRHCGFYGLNFYYKSNELDENGKHKLIPITYDKYKVYHVIAGSIPLYDGEYSWGNDNYENDYVFKSVSVNGEWEDKWKSDDDLKAINDSCLGKNNRKITIFNMTKDIETAFNAYLMLESNDDYKAYNEILKENNIDPGRDGVNGSIGGTDLGTYFYSFWAYYALDKEKINTLGKDSISISSDIKTFKQFIESESKKNFWQFGGYGKDKTILAYYKTFKKMYIDESYNGTAYTGYKSQFDSWLDFSKNKIDEFSRYDMFYKLYLSSDKDTGLNKWITFAATKEIDTNNAMLAFSNYKKKNYEWTQADATIKNAMNDFIESWVAYAAEKGLVPENSWSTTSPRSVFADYIAQNWKWTSYNDPKYVLYRNALNEFFKS